MRFIALERSLTLVSRLRPLLRVLRTHDESLARQITRADSSICLNLGEGSRRTGRDRKHH